MRAWHEWNKLSLPVPQCPRREVIHGDGALTDDEKEKGNGCAVVTQWERVAAAGDTADRSRMVSEFCVACPLNDGRIVRPSGLYAKAMDLLNELDMGLQIRRSDVNPVVLEATKLIRSERAILKEMDRDHAR